MKITTIDTEKEFWQGYDRVHMIPKQEIDNVPVIIDPVTIFPESVKPVEYEYGYWFRHLFDAEGNIL